MRGDWGTQASVHTCWTLEPVCGCRCGAGDSLRLRGRLSGAEGWRCCLFSIRQPLWRSLDAIVNVVFAGDGGQLLVDDVAMKTFKFQIAAVHVPNSAAERCSYLRRLGSFLDASRRTVLVGDWNAILDPNIDRAGWGASSWARCDSGLSDFLTEFDRVDRYHLDHPEREMWTWIGSSPSGQVRSYLDRVLVSRADSDLVTCPTFHWLGRSDHKLVRVSLWLAKRPSLASNWKFNTSLLRYGTSGCGWKT